jgi:hypothetical protein
MPQSSKPLGRVTSVDVYDSEVVAAIKRADCDARDCAFYAGCQRGVGYQDLAIAARMALIVGGATFDRLFTGVRFDEVDGDILYVYAQNEETAAEMEDNFALHISTVATDVLKCEVGIVLILPKQLTQ